IGLVMVSLVAFVQHPEPTRIWISDGLPVDLLLSINPLFENGGYTWTNDLESADLALDFEAQAGVVTTTWVYVPVVPFASTAEAIAWADIRRYWAGDLGALSYLTPDGNTPVFVTSNETMRAMVNLLGTPAENVPLQYTSSTEEITTALWNSRPYAWGIMGFSNLVPELKVLRLDRADVFGVDFDPTSYPLTTYINLKGE